MMTWQPTEKQLRDHHSASKVNEAKTFSTDNQLVKDENGEIKMFLTNVLNDDGDTLVVQAPRIVDQPLPSVDLSRVWSHSNKEQGAPPKSRKLSDYQNHPARGGVPKLIMPGLKS
jgi:hypothetical protein